MRMRKCTEKGPPSTESIRKRPFSLFRRSVQSVKSGIEEQGDAFKKSDLESLLNDLREPVALVKGRLPEALEDTGAMKVTPKNKPRLSDMGSPRPSNSFTP